MVAWLVVFCLWTGEGQGRQAPAQDDRVRAAALAEAADRQAAAGKLAEAVRTMETAERAAPGWAELKVNLAALRSAAGDYAGAIAAARAALKIDDRLEGAWINLGLAQLKSGDAPAAAATLGRYKDRPDAPASARAALAIALVQVGDASDAKHDWPAAEAAYRSALRVDPAVPRGHYSLGLLLYKQRRYPEAAVELDKELAIDADYPPALRYRAELELDRGEPAAALSWLGRLTRVAPDLAEGWRALGRARLDLGAPADALTALRQATSLAPDDPSAHFLLGRALTATGAAIEGQAAFARAADLNQRLRDQLQQRVSGKKGGG